MNIPIRPPQRATLADYDRQVEMELAEKLGTVIGSTLAAKPVETTAAVIAVLGYVLAHSDSIDTPAALDRTLDAVETLLLTNIRNALRVAARAQGNGVQ
jgi:hypothetical protein